MPRFITRKWIEVPEQSGSAEDRYRSSKQIRFKTSRLRSDLCDFSDAYIVVKGRVTANFNIRRVDYVNNDFLMLFFLIIFFFKEVQINKKLQLGMLLKQMLILLQTLLVIEETSLRVFLLETMKQ